MSIDTPLPEQRLHERQALVRLFLEYAAPSDPEANRIAEWIADSAIQPGHLWRAMGVSSRTELREILETHFPELAAGNIKDMRWKKYFYKLLCGWPGFHG